MLFRDVVGVFEQLEATASGNKMREILSSFFKKVPKDDIDKVAYLTLGSISSAYESINMGMADKMFIRSIAKATGIDEETIQRDFKKAGDLGAVAAQEIKGKGGKLTIAELFSQLHKIAATTGTGSQEAKIAILAHMLRNASPTEAKYIVRIALGILRMGVGDMTVLDSLAIAFTGEKKNKAILEHAYNLCPDVGIIAKTLATKGLKAVENIGVVVGRPIQMMLAQRADTLEEIQERMPQGIAAEEKYDGERVQIHKKGGKIVFFSRRLEDTTSQFPDIAGEIKKIKGDFIIEGEIVPIDKKTGAILPFQTLMQRRRKYEIERYSKEIPIVVFIFDVLYLNGKNIIKEPYTKRQAMLRTLIKKEGAVLKLARKLISTDLEAVEGFFNECVERGTEGIVAKNIMGEYQAGTRGYLWIKWKREYTKELRDTFDLVIVGAFAGRGRRSGTYGALLCASYNDKTDMFETVCKLGSGFNDKQLAELPRQFKRYQIPHKPARLNVHKNMKPDVWFEPVVVVEVTGAEITHSPIHTAGEKAGTGFALRFPRFIRTRDDKKPEQATTSKEIEKLAKK